MMSHRGGVEVRRIERPNYAVAGSPHLSHQPLEASRSGQNLTESIEYVQAGNSGVISCMEEASRLKLGGA